MSREKPTACAALAPSPSELELEQLQLEFEVKKEAAKRTKAAPVKRLPTAAERTLELCDTRPQRNRALPFVPTGPEVRTVYRDLDLCNHLRLAHAPRALCGAMPQGSPNAGLRPGVCAACRVEASRLRAVVVGRS